MSYVQLPYSVVEKDKPKIKLNLPKNYGANEYFKKLLYLSKNNDLALQNLIIDVSVIMP